MNVLPFRRPVDLCRSCGILTADRMILFNEPMCLDCLKWWLVDLVRVFPGIAAELL